MIEFRLIAQLFADGAAAGSGAGDGANAGSEAGSVAESKKTRKNPLAEVKYGIQEEPEAGAKQPEAEESTEEPKPEAEPTFEELIKGKFRDEYNSRMQAAIRDRLKNSKQAEERLKKLEPVLAAAAKRYGISAEQMDDDALVQAVYNDDDQYTDEAIEKGLDVATVKQIHQLDDENKRLRAQEEARIAESRTQAHFQQLVAQGNELKQLYPDFDLMAEMRNPAFVRLTRMGVDVSVKDAYELLHRDEILQAVRTQAAQMGEQHAVQSIAATGRRPDEPGANPQASADVRMDPSKLKKADFEEIAARVKRGEKIRY